MSNVEKTSNIQSPYLKTLIQGGREAMRGQNWSLAHDCWKKVIAEEPGFFEGWYRLGQASFKLDFLYDSVSYSESARAIQPEHIGNLTALARTYQRLGLPNKAVAVWEIVVGLSTDNYEAYYRLGQCFKALGDFVLAEKYFASAQIIKPDDIHAQMYRVEMLSKIGQVDRAIECWNVFVGLVPNDLDGWKRYASFLLKHKRYDDAESILLVILKKVPNEYDAVSQLARVFSYANRWKDVVELLAPICAGTYAGSANLNFAMRHQLARALDVMGRTQDAELHYREALKVQPGSVIVLTRLGRVLREEGRQREAVEVYREACKLEPLELANWQALIDLLAGLDRQSEARDALIFVESIVSHSPTNLSWLGRICESALLFDDALRLFKLAAEADPSMLRQVGLFCAVQGIFSEAIRYLARARDYEPNSIDVTEAYIRQLETCKLLGVSQEWVSATPDFRELLLPELLYEHMVSALLVRPHCYTPVTGRVMLVGSSLAGGGAERQLAVTAALLASEIPEVESVVLLLSTLSKQDAKDFYFDYISKFDVEIVILGEDKQQSELCKIGSPWSQLIMAFPLAQRGMILDCYREFVARRPEVVHAWQDTTCLDVVVAAALAGVPKIILSTRSTRPDNSRRRLKRYMRRGYMAVIRLPNVTMLNNSQAGARDYETWLNLPPGSVKVIHNGLKIDLLSRVNDDSEVKQYLAIPGSAPVIGGVFRMSEEKRPLLWVETAVEIARSIPNAHFVLAGDGPMRADMLNYAKDKGIEGRMHFLGQVDVALCLHAADVVLLTSRTEGLPNALIEAQLFGIPVVAPDVGGCVEAIENGVTGWVIKNASAESLAEKTIYVLSDLNWYAEAKKVAPRYVKSKFSADDMIKKTLDAYGIGQGSKFIGRNDAVATNNDVLHSLAIQACNNKFGDAKRLLLHAVNLMPSDVEINFNLGEVFFCEMKYISAAEHFKLVVSSNRNHVEGWRWLARTQVALEDFDDALASWRMVLIMAPEDIEGLSCMGEIFIRSCDASLAIDLLKKAHALNPSCPKVNRLLVRVYHAQGEYHFAIFFLLRLIFLKLKFLW
jgi:glycosyltransferase involved in cell wall biosynthesis/cytochrome c-type biogenesis protein CcmH/NrfG